MPKKENQTRPNQAANPVENKHIGNGLTKREAFAVAAMQGILASIPRIDRHDFDISTTCIASEAVEMADKLIEALNKD